MILRGIKISFEGNRKRKGIGCLFQRRLRLFSTENYQKAIDQFEKAIQLDSSNADYFYYKGNALSELDQNQVAILFYDKAIQLDPSNGDYFHTKGIALENLNDYEAAISCHDMA